MLNQEIIITDLNYQSDEFIPAKWARNPHIQTILPRILRKKPIFEPIWQRIATPDDDFLDLCWTEIPAKATHKPIVILFHGLAGGFCSPYANGLLHSFKQQGWLGVLMHYRGCSGQVNRKPYGYHSADTKDARFLIELLSQKYQTPIAATGVSIGGNILVQYLAEFSHDPILKAGLSISPPLDLAACSQKLQTGFSRLYQAYMLRMMNRTLNTKLLQHAQIGNIQSGKKVKLSSISEFDELVTAPLHNFKDAQDYYDKCSGISVLNQITTPLKIIHAKDDPFMTDAVIPSQPLPKNIDYLLTRYGGHIGFIGGTLRNPNFWLEQEVPLWFKKHF